MAQLIMGRNVNQRDGLEAAHASLTQHLIMELALEQGLKADYEWYGGAFHAEESYLDLVVEGTDEAFRRFLNQLIGRGIGGLPLSLNDGEFAAWGGDARGYPIRNFCWELSV